LQVVAFIFFALAIPTGVNAATFNVDRNDDDATATGCDDGTANDCSLRGAIIKANGITGDDIINVSAGTYTLTIGGTGEDAAATGDLDITEDLTIMGDSADMTVIQACAPLPPATNCTGIDRVFQILSGATVEIKDVTITNGKTATINQLGEDGGGIHNAGMLTLTDTFISNNSTGDGGDDQSGGGFGGFGGGIFNAGVGTTTLNNTTVIGNKTGDGGDATFPCPLCLGGFGGFGGGIYNNGTVTLIETTVSGNITGNGGNGVDGPGASGSSPGSGGWGGGILNAGILIVTKSTISGNTTGSSGSEGEFSGSGGNGGGIANSSTLAVTNSTISGNTTGGPDGNGGGIFNQGNVSLTNSTLSGNTAENLGEGGGIFNNSTLGIKNTIISNNIGFSDNNCSGLSMSADKGNNISNDMSCGFTGDGVDPLLDPLGLQGNGGATETIALQPGSPAIEAIPDGECTFDEDGDPDTPEVALLTDQRGVARPQPQDGLCDIGAFEAACGNSVTEADLGEECDDGNTENGDCCSDNCKFEELGAECGDPTDTDCDNPDSCDGEGSCQDNLVKDGTSCDDVNLCTHTDSCQAGVCIGTPVLCQEPVECQQEVICVLSTGLCEVVTVAPGSPCGDPSDTACDDPDTCDGAGNCQTNTVTCGGMNATICGTSGNNLLFGTSGPDVIHGLGGNDVINGFNGNDKICGGDGFDQLIGWNGNDALDGGSGFDACAGGNGADNSTNCEINLP
jgi:cysteine-rich repeat protein